MHALSDAVAEITARRRSEVRGRWRLAPGEYTLGGARGNDLVLDEPGVSNRHARLIVRADEVLIEDVGSRYGTKRDGTQIVGSVPFTRSRPVKIGDLVIEAESLAGRVPVDLPVATLPTVSMVRPAKPDAEKNRTALSSKSPVEVRRGLIIGGVILLAGVMILGIWLLYARQVRLRGIAAHAVVARQAAEARAQRAEAALAALKAAAPAPFVEPGGEAALLERLRPYRSQPGWNAKRLRLLPGGSHALDLSGLTLRDLAELRGLPISELDLSRTALAALPALDGFTLRRLALTGTAIRDLAPLRGQPLEELALDETNVTDLTPLAGLPLTKLTLHGTRLTDLAPLAGAPLHTLDLRDQDSIADFRPLLDCRRLTVLYAPAGADLWLLRAHPSLRLMALRTSATTPPEAVDGPIPVSAFWTKYGDRLRRRAAEKAR